MDKNNIYQSKRLQSQSQNIKDTFLSSLKNFDTIIVYDLETTGLNPIDNHIIQVSARKCIVIDDTLEETECRTWYINPGYALPSVIVELTGITDEMLADKPFEEDVIDEIAAFFGNEAVCGYNNIKFDDKFMESFFERFAYFFTPSISLDLYALVKAVIDPGETVNKKLQTLTEYFGLSDQVSMFHNADGDTMASLLCFNKCIERCKEQKIEEYTNLIPCVVSKVSYWENPRNQRQKRIYVTTDNAVFWYDVFNQIWHIKSQTDQISKYDMEDVIIQVLNLASLDDEEALSKFAGTVVA